MDEIIFTIRLEDGTELECTVIGFYEMGDKEYVALQPADDPEAEVFIYRYKEDSEGEPSIEYIESDEEYEEAVEAFEKKLDEIL